jgi:Ca2+-transporting ATPase
MRENEALAARALRVLAVAQRTIPANEFDPAQDLLPHVQGLTFAGLVGLMDLPRPEARRSIVLCRNAGIQIKMITGDHRTTAAAVADELGIAGRVLSGSDLDQLTDDDLAGCIAGIGVFARVTPEHKVRIVRALRRERHVVAMTGDGVNDAPALRTADIGVAMGRSGTEVTKEASDMVLTDDNFATIVRAVREGRMIYDNIGKFLRFQLSTNFGAVFSVFAAPLIGLPLPFNPIQILWVNIIMDGPPAMALGADPADPGVMTSPPRRRDSAVLSVGLIARLICFGLLMATGTLAVLNYGLATGSEGHARTLAFTTFVAFQVFNAFNVRSDASSVLTRHSLANRSLWLSLSGVILLQVMATNWRPAQIVFDGAELSAADGLIATSVGASILVFSEALKLAAKLHRRLAR